MTDARLLSAAQGRLQDGIGGGYTGAIMAGVDLRYVWRGGSGAAFDAPSAENRRDVTGGDPMCVSRHYRL